jgi:hypothetical protein
MNEILKAADRDRKDMEVELSRLSPENEAAARIGMYMDRFDGPMLERAQSEILVEALKHHGAFGRESDGYAWLRRISLKNREKLIARPMKWDKLPWHAERAKEIDDALAGFQLFFQHHNSRNIVGPAVSSRVLKEIGLWGGAHTYEFQSEFLKADHFVYFKPVFARGSRGIPRTSVDDYGKVKNILDPAYDSSRGFVSGDTMYAIDMYRLIRFLDPALARRLRAGYDDLRGTSDAPENTVGANVKAWNEARSLLHRFYLTPQDSDAVARARLRRAFLKMPESSFLKHREDLQNKSISYSEVGYTTIFPEMDFRLPVAAPSDSFLSSR